MKTFERLESEVRGYCRSFPTLFDRAHGSYLFAADGRRYIDFFAGAGVLSYGHNNPILKQHLLDYLARDGITHGLDMATVAKRDFLETFEALILEPRGLDYKLQFPGPTGTNAVEAALKLARKVTGRHHVISFTNGFHGMTLGSLAVTGNRSKRAGGGVPLSHATALPFDGYFGPEVDTLEQLSELLEDASSGLDLPAAIILETVQAEGGVNAARFDWLKRLAELARRHGVLLIVDDIQVGCGRTGPFFSFEKAGIEPDIVCLSKSISGFGLPMALVLIKPEHDVWAPGEHNGTFRGHNLAFVTATETLRHYWGDDTLERRTQARAETIGRALSDLARRFPAAQAEPRGRGLIQGMAFADRDLASDVSRQAFDRGLVIETAGPHDEVLKLLPALTIADEVLEEGLERIGQSLAAALAERTTQNLPQSSGVTKTRTQCAMSNDVA